MSFIVLEEVSFTYPGKKEPAVRDVSLQFSKGEKAAILGLNGSGKSTLAKLMLGLLQPQQGRVVLDGKPVEKYSLPEIGQKIGFVMQNPNGMLFSTSVFNEVAFGLRWKGYGKGEVLEACKDILNHFDLWHLRNELPFNLSEGEKQLVALSAILALQPDYLILDEPTKSIDVYRRKKLGEVLADIWSQGTGIIVISHDAEFVAGFNGRKVQMAKGEVIADEGGY